MESLLNQRKEELLQLRAKFQMMQEQLHAERLKSTNLEYQLQIRELKLQAQETKTRQIHEDLQALKLAHAAESRGVNRACESQLHATLGDHPHSVTPLRVTATQAGLKGPQNHPGLQSEIPLALEPKAVSPSQDRQEALKEINLNGHSRWREERVATGTFRMQQAAYITTINVPIRANLTRQTTENTTISELTLDYNEDDAMSGQSRIPIRRGMGTPLRIRRPLQQEEFHVLFGTDITSVTPSVPSRDIIQPPAAVAKADKLDIVLEPFFPEPPAIMHKISEESDNGRVHDGEFHDDNHHRTCKFCRDERHPFNCAEDDDEDSSSKCSF